MPEGCIRGLLEALTPARLEELRPKQAAEVAWALGVLQFRPDAGWWERYESALLRRTAAAAVDVVALSSDALRGPPPPSTLLDAMPGRQLCEVAWACAALRLVPSAPLLSALAAAAARRLPSLPPSSLSNLLWSMAVLDPGGEVVSAPPPPFIPQQQQQQQQHRWDNAGSPAARALSPSPSGSGPAGLASNIMPWRPVSSSPGPDFSPVKESPAANKPPVAAASAAAASTPPAPSWRAWTDLWLKEASGKMPLFDPQDLAMAASALATMRCGLCT